jgi:hypothetical protein
MPVGFVFSGAVMKANTTERWLQRGYLVARELDLRGKRASLKHAVASAAGR